MSNDQQITTKPRINLIAAVARKNRVIGYKNKLLWRLPGDLKRFKDLTSGHPIIMGRKTFESLGKPLPNRTNIIITRNPEFKAENCMVVDSLKKALDQSKLVDLHEIFVIGGGEIFTQSLPIANRLYLTLVEGDFEGDAFFPDYADFNRVILEEKHEENGLQYTFLDLER